MSEQAKRETWQDWLPAGVPAPPDEDLLTREQVINTLHRWRVNATADDLRFWERGGILPPPIRRWHAGATRALYPPWYLSLVRQLRQLQRRGYPLESIGSRLYAYVQATQGHAAADDEAPLPLRSSYDRGSLLLPPSLIAEMEAFAHQHSKVGRVPVSRLELHVIDAKGYAIRYPWPIEADETGPTAS